MVGICSARVDGHVAIAYNWKEFLFYGGWPEGWGPQGMTSTGGGGLVRVPNLRVCKHPFDIGVAQAGRKGEFSSRPAEVPSSRRGKYPQ